MYTGNLRQCKYIIWAYIVLFFFVWTPSFYFQASYLHSLEEIFFIEMTLFVLLSYYGADYCTAYLPILRGYYLYIL
jgi:hypothetical protein